MTTKLKKTILRAYDARCIVCPKTYTVRAPSFTEFVMMMTRRGWKPAFGGGFICPVCEFEKGNIR